MRLQRRGQWMITFWALVATSVGCGHEEQISEATGFFQNKPTSKFKSAIFDIKEYSPGRKVTYVFLGHDDKLCDKLRSSPTQSGAQAPFSGSLIAAAWTGEPKSFPAPTFALDHTRADALSTGVPNNYKYVMFFSKGVGGEIQADTNTRGNHIFIDDAGDQRITGTAHFEAQDSDSGFLRYTGQRCNGLAEVARHWFTTLH